ncbi:MAG: aminoacyl-histidine dipeptidase [Saprospiraceae bacterium]|nr:aminoacyl-histidine dipeptidase [Saprospiraceae bacterium]
MSNDIRSLEPRSIWKNFADLNEVPRPSKKEERVIQFMKSFGEKLELETTVDEIGNVIIKKPATPGMENREKVVMQAHLDMVHQKNADTAFDFDSEGIRMVVEGDWVKAEGTTLGADNGLGVAAIMAYLESDTLVHPAIEALFTIDEETGMTGAKELKPGSLTGKILLNLDTEEDNELTIGCAGGIDVTMTGDYVQEDVPSEHTAYNVIVKGFKGGHSGMDIHLGRGNANKIMNRILSHLNNVGLRIAGINGGGLRNAIPRESFATVTVPNDAISTFESKIDGLSKVILTEYELTDPEATILIEETKTPEKVMSISEAKVLLNAVYACPNGIYRLTPKIENLVQTSNNLARVLVEDGKYTVMCLTRSSVDSEKEDLANTIKAAFSPTGAEVKFSGSYPGWAPRPTSEIVAMMSDLYKELFNEEAHVNACHAGLECGILGRFYPDMEMISFGPNILGAHSPEERTQISSVQKFWGFLNKTMERIPEVK